MGFELSCGKVFTIVHTVSGIYFCNQKFFNNNCHLFMFMHLCIKLSDIH